MRDTDGRAPPAESLPQPGDSLTLRALPVVPGPPGGRPAGHFAPNLRSSPRTRRPMLSRWKSQISTGAPIEKPSRA